MVHNIFSSIWTKNDRQNETHSFFKKICFSFHLLYNICEHELNFCNKDRSRWRIQRHSHSDCFRWQCTGKWLPENTIQYKGKWILYFIYMNILWIRLNTCNQKINSILENFFIFMYWKTKTLHHFKSDIEIKVKVWIKQISIFLSCVMEKHPRKLFA